MPKKEEVMERFKCLICGTQFTKTKEALSLALEESKDAIKHPDDLKNKIICSSCGAHQVQHLGSNSSIIEKKKKVIKENTKSIFDFLGNFLGNVVAVLILTWEECQFMVAKRIFSFVGFILSTLILNNIFDINPLYSCLISLLFIFIIKIKAE